MKNHTDVLIFHRRVCAGATNPESQMKNHIRRFFIACLRKERSGMGGFYVRSREATNFKDTGSAESSNLCCRKVPQEEGGRKTKKIQGVFIQKSKSV